MKKIIYLTCLFLSFSIITNAYDFEVDGNYYSLISTSELTVAFCGTSNKGDIVIPEKVTFSGKTLTVTEIGKYAFQKCTGINSVTIPESVTILGECSMFNGDFETVSLPQSLKTIEEQAFLKCAKLKSISIPDNVSSIGFCAFDGCISLTNIKLPNNNWCYLHGTSFQNGPKPTGCLTIPSNLYFQAQEDGIYYVVFDDCSMLDSLIFEDGESSFTARSGSLWRAGRENSEEFGKCQDLDYVYIGRYEVRGGWGSNVRVRKVVYGDLCHKQYAYYSSGSSDNVFTKFDSAILEEIVFGKNMSKITLYKNSSNLKAVYVRSSTPPSAEGFPGKAYIYATLFVPKGSLEAYQSADVWKEFWNIEEYDTGTSDIQLTGKNTICPKSYYDLKGNNIGIPQKGLNIVKYYDGTVRKVMY